MGSCPCSLESEVVFMAVRKLPRFGVFCVIAAVNKAKL